LVGGGVEALGLANTASSGSPMGREEELLALLQVLAGELVSAVTVPPCS